MNLTFYGLVALLFGVYLWRRKERQAQFSAGSHLDSFLVSGSATTGWSDWIHGELWLTPTGIVRRKTDVLASLFNPLWPLVGNKAKQGHIDQSTKKARSDLLINFKDILGYNVHKGFMNGKLTLSLKNGQDRIFLFLLNDMDYRLLTDTLDSRLLRSTDKS